MSGSWKGSASSPRARCSTSSVRTFSRAAPRRSRPMWSRSMRTCSRWRPRTTSIGRACASPAWCARRRARRRWASKRCGTSSSQPTARAAGCSPASSRCIEASPVVRKGHPRGGLLFCSESSARGRALGARATRALRRREPRAARSTPARRTLDDIAGRTHGSRPGAISRSGRRTRCVASPTASPTTPARRAACWCGAGSSKRWARRSRSCAMPSSGWKNGSRALARLTRLLRIFAVGLRFGLHEFIPRFARNPFVRLAARRTGEPRAQRLREALETLGPIYVKFGQVLATRRDLVPLVIADELAKLQGRGRPCPSDLAIAEIEKGLGRRIEAVFATFEREPVASASIAQVHLARLHDGREVAVKVLRPRVEEEIAKDVALLTTAADFVERLWPDGRRLKPREVVAEFARHLEDELNLMHEAANASQLRRNFERSALLLVPEVHWDLCSERVMVMQRMHGTPVSQVETLRAKGIDIPALARAGVEIFFTQVFRDGFFHADMHPGNILVTTEGEGSGRYVALDFGIMGTLTEVDKNYLAQNFLAFFNRDYRRVAQAHLDAGWVPADTRIDEFETAIRAVCEPVFARPLK